MEGGSCEGPAGAEDENGSGVPGPQRESVALVSSQVASGEVWPTQSSVGGS